MARANVTRQVNICFNSDDLFHRYKRDQIETGFVKSNGGQTLILNLEKIAKQLHLDPTFLVRSLQRVLGKPIRLGNVIKGRVDKLVLESALNKVIANHVLCPNCGLPELDASLKRCNACGHTREPT